MVETGLGRAKAAATWLVLAAGGAPAVAQTDYYNLDRNRPSRVEDAYATERYAFELKLAPVRLERERGGVYHWGIDPELAYGLLPRTHIEAGLPYVVIDAGDGGRQAGLSGIELSALHNLNTETRTLPAFGVRAAVLLPVGGMSAERTYPSLTAIATRTYRIARFHVNAQYTFGAVPQVLDAAPPPEAPGAGPAATAEITRWFAGLAVDRVFPLRALLVIGDVHAQQPLHEDEPVAWNAGIGVRYQVNPYLAVDAGLGRRLSGSAAWHVTFGSAFAFGLRPFVRVPSM